MTVSALRAGFTRTSTTAIGFVDWNAQPLPSSGDTHHQNMQCKIYTAPRCSQKKPKPCNFSAKHSFPTSVKSCNFQCKKIALIVHKFEAVQKLRMFFAMAKTSFWTSIFSVCSAKNAMTRKKEHCWSTFCHANCNLNNAL